jgi:hypothetical protein
VTLSDAAAPGGLVGKEVVRMSLRRRWFKAGVLSILVAVGNMWPRLAQAQGGFASSGFVDQTVPSHMTAGRSYTASVTFENTGGGAWTHAGGIRLGSAGNSLTWGVDRIGFADWEAILPGTRKTFTFTVTAPPLAGQNAFQWRLLHEPQGWFGPMTRRERTPSARWSRTVPSSCARLTS